MTPPSGSRSLLSEGGGAAIEFAVVLPAVVLVLALGLGGVRAAALRLLAQDAAADAARSLGRGDPRSEADARVGQSVPGATVRVEERGDLVCAVVTVGRAVPLLPGVSVRAASCALSGGR